MNRWDRIEELFSFALTLTHPERREFLLRECGQDLELLQQVARLLSSEVKADARFLRPPPPPPVPRFPVSASKNDPLIGQTVGAYSIKEIIACGGMGTVFLAEQANPKRQVAFKVIYASALSPAVARRFEVESRILAFLHHPNIAPVYEAGSHRLENGTTVRYFAMEYVPEARTISRYATDRSLSQRNRLELFLQLCDAVHHGHQKGIIHRDLKPANVLVGGDHRVKVIDFGVARSTDSDIAATTMHTEAGQILGTLAYMSPEQCAADPSHIDTTTDVYSLGMILFELLTGRMPYDVSNMSIQSALRVICEKEPARPSEFDRRMRGDMETIILKSLEKDRAKRYQSVAELAADIRRYLNREPIAARPPTAWTGILRWAVRHPRFATVGLCIGIVVLIAAGTTASLYWLDLRPDRIVISPDKHQARVLSWRGRTLKTWDAGLSGAVHFGEIVRAPTEFGGKRLGILGFARSSSIWNGSLCAFDIDDDWEQPIWQRSLESNQYPDDLIGRGPGSWGFGVRNVCIADVFPDEQSVGPEIMVTFQHEWSRRALRVYDMRGALLFQIWHDGSLGPMCWLSDARLLVCTGGEEQVKERFISARMPIDEARVVFAIRPTFRFISRKYLRREPVERDVKLAWYKYVHPVASPGLRYDLGLTSDTGGYAQGHFVRLHIGFTFNSEFHGGPSMIIDEQGNAVGDTFASSDRYEALRRSNSGLPTAKDFSLRDEPPSITDVRPASQPAAEP